MKNILVIVLIMMSPQLFAQNIEELLDKWGLSEYPIEKIQTLKRLNRESFHKERIFGERHILYIENGKLNLRIDDNYPRGAKLIIGEIEYTATDKGEFGGELGFIHHGTYKKLLDGNVRKLLPYGDKLYIIEGLAHMISHGSIYIINNIHNPTTPTKVTLLPESPNAAFLEESGRLVLAGSNGLYSVTETYLKIIYWDAFWSEFFYGDLQVL